VTSRVAHAACVAGLSLGFVAAAPVPDGERVVLGHLSRKLGMSADALRAQRAQTGLGCGDLFHGRGAGRSRHGS